MAPDATDETLTLEDFLDRPERHQRAACRGVGVAGYVLGRGEGEYSREGCAVREECLATALADVSLTGLWCGTTTRERMAMRRQRVA
jgi:Transcription factor WhiB